MRLVPRPNLLVCYELCTVVNIEDLGTIGGPGHCCRNCIPVDSGQVFSVQVLLKIVFLLGTVLTMHQQPSLPFDLIL